MVGARAGFINSVSGGFGIALVGVGRFRAKFRAPCVRLAVLKRKIFRCASHGQGLGVLQKATPLRCRAPLGEISCAKDLVGGFETKKIFAARAMDRFGSFTESNVAAQGKCAKRAGLLGKARPFYYHYCACRSPVMSS